MRKFISAALAALCLLAAPALPAQADGHPPYAIKVVTLLASAARTTTGNTIGAWWPTAVATTPIGISVAVAQEAEVFLNATVTTTGTLDLTVQGSFDNGTTTCTLSPLVGSASSAWTQVTTSPSKQVRRYAGPLPPLIRAVADLESTPSYTFAVQAVLGGG